MPTLFAAMTCCLSTIIFHSQLLSQDDDYYDDYYGNVYYANDDSPIGIVFPSSCIGRARSPRLGVMSDRFMYGSLKEKSRLNIQQLFLGEPDFRVLRDDSLQGIEWIMYFGQLNRLPLSTPLAPDEQAQAVDDLLDHLESLSAVESVYLADTKMTDTAFRQLLSGQFSHVVLEGCTVLCDNQGKYTITAYININHGVDED